METGVIVVYLLGAEVDDSDRPVHSSHRVMDRDEDGVDVMEREPILPLTHSVDSVGCQEGVEVSGEAPHGGSYSVDASAFWKFFVLPMVKKPLPR